MFWHSPDDLCNYEIHVAMYGLELMGQWLCKLQGYLLLVFISKYCHYWGKKVLSMTECNLQTLFFTELTFVFARYTVLWSSCWGSAVMVMSWCAEFVQLSHPAVWWWWFLLMWVLSFYCLFIDVYCTKSGDSIWEDVVFSPYLDKCDVILLKQHHPSVQFCYLHSSGKKWL